MSFVLALMMAAETPTFETKMLSDRTKTVPSAPEGYPATWKEKVEAIISTNPADADFNRMMIGRAEQLARDYYDADSVDTASFDTQDQAGALDVGETVEAASPDIISANAGASYYDVGMAHPNSDAHYVFIWSRRLRRVLKEQDVFARAPDKALGMKALAAFDNKEGVDADTVRNGLPLDWGHVSIVSQGITWTFGPYELGGYVSGGSATVRWADLKPYLRRDLPFVIETIRKVAPTRK